MMPPYLLDMRFTSEDGRRHRLWLPLFLLWPLALVLVVLALVLTLLVDVALLVAGKRYHYYTLLLGGLLGLFSELRGTSVHIHQADTLVDFVIR